MEMYPFPAPAWDALTIREVQTPAEWETVYQLTYQNYRRRNMCRWNSEGILRHQPHLDHAARTQVMLAYQNAKPVGTLSISLADKMEELYNYSTFQAELERFHMEMQCEKMFSGWRLATLEEGIAGQRVTLFLLLQAMRRVIKQGYEWGYLCFQPQDLRFYSRLDKKGIVIGQKYKQDGAVEVELTMWRGRVTLEGYKACQERYLRLFHS